MNKIYKLVWSKSKNMYVAVSEFAKSHTKAPSAGVISRTVVAGVLVSVISCGAVMPVTSAQSNPPADANYVIYVDSTAATIELEGPTGTGTKITNLAAGDLSAASTDAVNGAQLYAITQQFDDFQSALSRNNTSIARAQTDINNIKTTNLTLQSDVNTLKTQVETGFNVNISGAKVKAVTPESNYINFKAGPGVSIIDDNETIKIGLSTDGAVEADNTGAITGDTAFTELRPANANYVQQANTTAANLGALDTQLKTVTDGLASEITNRQNADSALSDRIGTIPAGSTGQGHHLEDDKSIAENLVNLDTALGEISDNAVVYDGTDKSKVTLGGTDGTTIDKVKAATLDANSKEAVNGSQLFQTNQALDQEISDRTQAVTAETTARTEKDTDLQNQINQLSTGSSAAVEALSDRVGTLDADGNYIKKDDTVSANLKSLDTAIGGYPTGSTYNYINPAQSVVANLGALDLQVKTNADAIIAEQEARQTAITNIANTIGTLSENVVHYDTDDKSLVTFGGSTGTKLTNLKQGVLSASSKDAVTGAQLYATNQNIAGFAADITRNKENIRELNTSVSAALDTVSSTSALVDTIDSLKADASLNNLTAAGRQVISTAAVNAVQEYMAQQNGGNSTPPAAPNTSGVYAVPTSAPVAAITVPNPDAGNNEPNEDGVVVPQSSVTYVPVVPAAPQATDATTTDDFSSNTSNNSSVGVSSGPSLRMAMPAAVSADANVVVYDDASGSVVTLEGEPGTGTRITNLAEGELAAASTDAVTGAQLYAVTQQFDDFQSALSRNNTSIARAQTDINNIKTTNLNLQSDVNTLKTQMETGFNVTVDGALVKNMNPDSNYVNLTTGDHMEITNDNGSVKISAKADGSVASGNQGLVSGAAVYNAIQDAIAGSESGTGANLSHKANADASNVGTNASTDNSELWGQALGTGEVADGNQKLITGDTLYNEVRPANNGTYIDASATVGDNLKALDTATKANTDDIASLKDMSDISSAGEDVIRNIAKGAVKVINGNNTTVTKGTDGDADTYAVNVVANGQAVQGNTGLVTGGTLYNALQDAIAGAETGTGAALTNKANTDASNVGVNATTDNSELWGQALGTGMVAQGNNKLITGGTLYSETRSSDGNYVSAGNTAAQNVSALDTQLKTQENTINDIKDMNNLSDTAKDNIRDIAKGAVKVVAGTNTTVTEGTSGDAKTYAVNVSANGTVSAGNTGIVTGGTVYTAIQDAVGGIAGGEISPTSDGFVSGKQVYNEVHTEDGQYVRGDNTTGQNLKALDDAVAAHDTALTNLQNSVDNSANTDMSNLSEAGKQAIRDIAGNPIDIISSNNSVGVSSSNVDGKTVYDLTIDANGVVASGNTGLVTGDTVYRAIRNVSGFTGDSTGEGAIAIGGTANGDGATAIGEGSEANGDKATAVGADNKVNGDGSTAVGHDNEVTGTDSTAVGANNKITGDNSNTVGSGNTTVGDFTNTFGNNNDTNGDYNNIFGNDNTTEGNGNSVVGNSNNTTGDRNNVFGSDNTVEGDNNSLLGNTNSVTGDNNALTGNGNTLTGDEINVNGNDNNVTGNRDTVVGHNNTLTGNETHIHGNDNTVNGDFDYIFGSNTTVTGSRDTAIGNENTVSADDSHTVGNGNTIEGNNSHAFGNGNTITSENGTAFGNTNTVTGIDSGAFGQRNTVAGNGAYAIGNDNNIADGANDVFVLGADVNATGSNSVVLGRGSDGSQDNVISVGAEGAERKIIHVADGTVAENSKDAVNGGQLYQVQQDYKQAKDIDISKWAEKLGTGEVVEGNTNLVTGGTVYDAIRRFDTTDGAFNVDHANGTIHIGGDARHDDIDTVDFSKSDGSSRVLTGIATNPNDATSAANVGYVDAIGQNIIGAMNDRFSRTDDRINKVGAGAAAMAGLVPGPMEGDEKFSFSASVGNFRNATAGALGAFYKPAENVMLAVKGSFGNGENMISGGIGVSLNKGNTPSVSKSQMVQTINAQAGRINEQQQQIEIMRAQMNQMAQAMESLRAQTAQPAQTAE